VSSNRPRFAEIALNQGGPRQTYHYQIPDPLPEGFPIPAIGHLVEVSFGVSRATGVIIALADDSPVPKTKPILAILDPLPVVNAKQIAVARWMADHTLSTIGACLWLNLPPGITRSADRVYRLLVAPSVDVKPGTLADQVIALLSERGALRGAQIDHALETSGWRAAIKPLLEDGTIEAEAALNAPTVGVKQSRTVQLATDRDSASVQAEAMSLRANSKRRRILEFLLADPGPHEAHALLAETGADNGALKRLIDGQWVHIGSEAIWRDPLAGKEFVSVTAPSLTRGQAECWAILERAIEQQEPATYLLNGVTGSGKTELYLRAIEKARAQGRAAIVMVPEIALVPQTVRRFMARFGSRIALVHSGLTPGQQFDTWRRVRDGLVDIVIGARSALFMPFDDIGVIVIDEEHDGSYKQSPPIPPPYYHARDVAMHMAAVFNATVILGSATPDLTTSWRAEHGSVRQLHLPDRILVHRQRLEEQQQQLDIPLLRYSATETPEAYSTALPPVAIVDMRAELRADNRSMFSRALRTALDQTLARGEQAILYLNRRGSASFVLCRDCGYIARCPRCDMPLTYHEGQAQLICHQCNYRMEQPTICPECGSHRIRYFGAGTEALEKTLAEEFPEARTIRWDRDTTRGRDAHENILHTFSEGHANVLIGTQMIAKGLDIPRVTLVGVMLADTALGLPDYRAGERAFQLLTQVAGRAGRGWLGGQAIIQTYQPDHYAIQAAARHDYKTFQAQELEFRHLLGYPPFKRLARVLFRFSSDVKAQAEAERAAAAIFDTIQRKQLTATQVIGPAPSFFHRVNDVFRWQILVKGPDPAEALQDVRVVPGIYIDIDPLDIL
jgi:primosomal protein N' (replication factor Y)